MSGDANTLDPGVRDQDADKEAPVKRAPDGHAATQPVNEPPSAQPADEHLTSQAHVDASGRKPAEEPASAPKGKLGAFISFFRPSPPKDGNSKLAKSEAEQFYGHLRDQKKLDLGWIGIVIGHGIEKLGNIAFISILICFGIVVGLVWFPVDSDTQFREKTAATLFGIINLALGYLFGKTTVAADQPRDKDKQ